MIKRIAKMALQSLVCVSIVSGLIWTIHRSEAQQINTPTLGVPIGEGGLTPFEAPCVSSTTPVGTGTTEMLVRSSFTSAGTNVIQGVFSSVGNPLNQAAGPGYISWIMVSTGAPSDYIIIRDTGVLGAGNSGLNAQILPNIQFSTTTGNGPISQQMYTFTPPVRFLNGLTLQMQGSGTTRATICYRSYAIQNQ